VTWSVETGPARILLAVVAWVAALTSGAVLVIAGIFYMVFVRGFASARSGATDVLAALLFLGVWLLIVTAVVSFLIGPRQRRFSAGLKLALPTAVGLAIGPIFKPNAFVAVVTPSGLEAPRSSEFLPFWFGLWCLLGLIGAVLGASWAVGAGSRRGDVP